MRRFFRLLVWVFSGGADAARHAELERRFPDAYVLRAQAVKGARESIAAFGPAFVPARDARLSLVVDDGGFGLWTGSRQPSRFLEVPWSSIGEFGTRGYVDYPIRDLIARDGGHITHLLVVAVGDGKLELALWGDDDLDQTVSLLDDYGLRTVIARLEARRPA